MYLFVHWVTQTTKIYILKSTLNLTLVFFYYAFVFFHPISLFHQSPCVPPTLNSLFDLQCFVCLFVWNCKSKFHLLYKIILSHPALVMVAPCFFLPWFPHSSLSVTSITSPSSQSHFAKLGTQVHYGHTRAHTHTIHTTAVQKRDSLCNTWDGSNTITVSGIYSPDSKGLHPNGGSVVDSLFECSFCYSQYCEPPASALALKMTDFLRLPLLLVAFLRGGGLELWRIVLLSHLRWPFFFFCLTDWLIKSAWLLRFCFFEYILAGCFYMFIQGLTRHCMFVFCLFCFINLIYVRGDWYPMYEGSRKQMHLSVHFLCRCS